MHKNRKIYGVVSCYGASKSKTYYENNGNCMGEHVTIIRSLKRILSLYSCVQTSTVITPGIPSEESAIFSKNS